MHSKVRTSPAKQQVENKQKDAAELAKTKRIPRLRLPLGHKNKKASEKCSPPGTCDWPPGAESEPKGFKPSMSLGAINTYKSVRGVYPQLDVATHNYYKARGELPEDLSGAYPTLLEKQLQQQQQPAAAEPDPRQEPPEPEPVKDVWGNKRLNRQQAAPAKTETLSPSANKWNQVGNLKF